MLPFRPKADTDEKQTDITNVKMGYEDHVYLAKLAEQAERYEGEYLYCIT